MDDYLIEMAEILEEDEVKSSDELSNFESWDSLAVLSVAAMADEKFGVNLSAQEINDATTVEGLYQVIIAKKAA